MIVVLSSDLLLSTRILDAADAVGSPAERHESPRTLPPAKRIRLLLVDWAEREPDWGTRLNAWTDTVAGPAQPRIILYGPHAALAAHADARAAGLGPMWARSKLVAELPRLLASSS